MNTKLLYKYHRQNKQHCALILLLSILLLQAAATADCRAMSYILFITAQLQQLGQAYYDACGIRVNLQRVTQHFEQTMMTKNKNCCNSTVRAFSQSTSRSNLEMSVWSSAWQVDRSAPPWQWQRSHSESLETSRRLRSLESDAMVLANFALTMTTATLYVYIHTHIHLMAIFPGLPGWASTRKVKPIWIILKQK